MNLAPTWKAYFASRESNARGNKSPMAYLSAWSNDVPPEAKLQLLSNDPDIAILAGDSGQNVMILHNFKNLGGTILSPSDKLACLLGGSRMAPVIIVNDIIITEEASVMTPPAETILACTSVLELLDLTAPLAEENEDTITFRGSTTFLPPPWLQNTIFEARSDDPLELILAAKAGATSFNEQQLAIDPTYNPTTDITLNEFAMWAWAVKNKEITPTTYYLDPNDEAMDNHQYLRHQQCILPLLPPPPTGTGAAAPPGHPPTFVAQPAADQGIPAGTIPTAPVTPTPTNANDIILQQLAVSITRQSEIGETHNELFARQLEHNMEKEDKKKDRLKKFHPSIKQLILFASADDADIVPDEILDSCKRVINADTVINAEQELNLQFGNLGMQDAHFAPGFVTALYSGKFVWSKNFTPNNLSPFMICESEPLLSSEDNQRRLTLHLEDTTGKTSDDITTGGKLTVKAPTKFHEMLQQLKFFRGACTIFFGPSSVAVTSLKALIDLVDKNKHIFKSNEIETEFMSKFLFAVDRRFQLWMESCMIQTTRSEVDDGILNFTPLVDSIRFSNFDLRLPLTFTTVQDKPTEAKSSNKRKGGSGGSGGSGGDQENSNENSKKKKKGGNKVNNTHQPDQFKMRMGETWQTHFANKNVDKRVTWEGDAKMCPRWFIGGYCFDNCFHKSSHVNADDIPAEKAAAFKSFLDTIRGN